MLEIAHVKGKHSTLIILHAYPLCKWLQGGGFYARMGEKRGGFRGGEGKRRKGVENQIA